MPHLCNLKAPTLWPSVLKVYLPIPAFVLGACRKCRGLHGVWVLLQEQVCSMQAAPPAPQHSAPAGCCTPAQVSVAAHLLRSLQDLQAAAGAHLCGHAVNQQQSALQHTIMGFAA